MKSLKSLNKYFWKYRWRLALGVVFIVFTNVFAIIGPELVNQGVSVLQDANNEYFEPIEFISSFPSNFDIDEFVKGEEIELPESLSYIDKFTLKAANNLGALTGYDDLLDSVAYIALLLAGLYILTALIKGLFLFMTRQTIIVMSRLIEFDLKNEVYDHYQKLSLAFYKRNNTGDIMNRISEDVSKVRMYLGPAVMYTLNLIVMLILVISAMLSVNVELTMYSLLPLPFMSVCIYFVSSRINKISDQVQSRQSDLSTMVQESFSGIRVLKAYHRELQYSRQFKEQSDDYKTKALNLVTIEALFIPIIVFLVGFSTILTIYIGGTKVIAGELELGQIFKFVFFVNMLTWPFAAVGWVTSLVQKAEASQKRINEFLDEKPEIRNDNSSADEIQGKIDFKNVSFTYPDSGITAINQVTFDVNPGETLAVIGKTGSGKSTLAALISRMYDVTGGSLLIDNKDIQKINLDSLRSSIGYVPQEVFLFSDTIENNIGFGLDDYSDTSIIQAAKDAVVHENIINFPKGYKTSLGERGINLSGGQKQRISIARAIAKNPQILIFDDCLSAVDTETEERILENLKRIMNNKTTVIISHRVSSIKHADKILVLDLGKIKEQGTHDELLALKGDYFKLYQRQLLEDSE